MRMNGKADIPVRAMAVELDTGGELGAKEIRGVADQACRFGLENIIVTGEALSPALIELIGHIRALGMTVDMYAAGTEMTGDMADRLFGHRVNVIIEKTGGRDFHSAVGYLLSAGYPCKDAFLAVGAQIRRENLHELTVLWKWARDKAILPFFEISATGETACLPDPEDIRELFFELSRTDADDYGIRWDPKPPFPGPVKPPLADCCVLTSDGEVQPRPGIPIPLGNVREKTLASILADSEILASLNDFRRKIKGPCRKCKKADHCCGNRGVAWRMTGDYMASDPLCWKNRGKTDQITYLPVSADRIIPQKNPMRVVSKLVEVKERYAEVEATVEPESPFAGEDGRLDEVVFLEMMAQAAAAMNAFEYYDTGHSPHKGALLGGKNIKITGKARVGTPLVIRVTKKAKLGNFGVVNAVVLSGENVIASGDIKVFREDPQ